MKIKMSFTLLLLFICLFCHLPAQAQTSAFTYQGRLTQNSTPANASYTMKFRLYDSIDQTGQVGDEITMLVTPVNGIFTVKLDFLAASFPAGSNRWLEVQIGATTLAPRTQLLSSPYAVRSLDANNADNAANANNAANLGGVAANQYALKTDTAPNSLQLDGVAAGNYLQKSGGTMTGTLNLPANGLNVGTNQIAMSTSASGTGNVMIGAGAVPDTFGGSFAVPFNRDEKFVVNGNVTVPAASNYGYRTPKTYRLRLGPADFVSVNSAVYLPRIDDGFSSGTVNGLNSMWATGGAAGTAAYFVAPVHLPDQSAVTGFSAQLGKNGGSLQSIVELYRSDASGYNANTAQLIATAATTTSGGIVWNVSAGSINSSFNVIDNTSYTYFIRWSGEQNTQNVRLNAVTVTYQVIRAD